MYCQLTNSEINKNIFVEHFGDKNFIPSKKKKIHDDRIYCVHNHFNNAILSRFAGFRQFEKTSLLFVVIILFSE